MTRLAKYLVLLFFSSLWLMVMLVRSERVIGQEKGLDEGWIFSLATMWKQGEISGRDFHFSYGPLAQIMSWLGTILNDSNSPINSCAMIIFIWSTFALLFIALALSLIKELSWRNCIWVYICMISLDLFYFSYFNLRAVLPILYAVFLHRTISVKIVQNNYFWAASSGLLLFLVQLISPDLAIYGFLSICFLFPAFAYASKSSFLLYQAVLIFSVYLLGNFAIAFVFKASALSNITLFSYQTYLFETIRGYKNTMGLTWDIDKYSTMLLVFVGLYTFIGSIVAIKCFDFLQNSLLVCLLTVSLFSLGGVVIRSDITHILHSITPFAFTFIIFGQTICFNHRSDTSYKLIFGRLGWCLTFILLFIALPTAQLDATRIMRSIIHGDISIYNSWNAIRNRNIQPDQWIPENIIESVKNYPESSLLSFPYDNYFPVLMEKKLIAPVLQSYAAMTKGLEEWYVEKLQQENDLNVIYNASAWSVDGVSPATRTPIIFEYLLTHFTLEPKTNLHSGIYLLRRRPITKKIITRNLIYNELSNNESLINISFDGPTSCRLLKLYLKITYPRLSSLLRPVPIEITLHSEEGERTVKVLPLKMNEPFFTYIPLLSDSDTYLLFRNDLSPSNTASLENITIKTSQTDLFGILPIRIELGQIECVDLIDQSH